MSGTYFWWMTTYTTNPKPMAVPASHSDGKYGATKIAPRNGDAANIPDQGTETFAPHNLQVVELAGPKQDFRIAEIVGFSHLGHLIMLSPNAVLTGAGYEHKTRLRRPTASG